MTDYITIQGVRKRDFTIQAYLPKTSDAVTVVLLETRITRNGDTRIARNGFIRMARNSELVYPRLVEGARKRSFVIHAKVKNG